MEPFEKAATPEALGIPSGAVLRMLQTLEGASLCMHGLLIARGGRIAAEGYWAPFSADRLHRLYSVSKSVTSLAVGCLVDEGKLSLDARAAAFFPELLPKNLHPYLAETTVRHLLMMATPHDETSYRPTDPDFVKTFFHKRPSHPPGTIFHYDTGGTVVLTAIVERLAGRPMLDYLRPRVLEPLGISPEIACVQTPEGRSWGGSGVLATLRDMAKLAQLCLWRGRWNGRQIISAAYIDAATARQIDNSFSPEEQAGYGYQIWRLPENGFMFYGMGGQYAFCFPDKELLVAFHADTQIQEPWGKAKIREAVFGALLPAVADGPLPETADTAALTAALAGLRMRPVAGAADSPAMDRIAGKAYRLDENPMGIRRLTVLWDAGGGVLRYETPRGVMEIPFGLGALRDGVFPETHYYAMRIGVPAGRGLSMLASGAWVEPEKLHIVVQIADVCFGALRIELAFPGREVSVRMTKQAEWFLEEYQGFAGGRMEGYTNWR